MSKRRRGNPNGRKPAMPGVLCSRQLQAPVPSEWYERLYELATARGATMAALVREAVAAHYGLPTAYGPEAAPAAPPEPPAWLVEQARAALAHVQRPDTAPEGAADTVPEDVADPWRWMWVQGAGA